MESILTGEERSQALELCSKHLGGPWSTSDHSKTIVNKLSGGMSNLLYRCILNDTNDYEPNQVLLRLYGPSYCDIDQQIEIFNQLASKNLGPSLYAAFPEGRLEEYLDSSPLSAHEMTHEGISKAIARKIAEIHKMNVLNLDKTSNWLMNRYKLYNSFITQLSYDSMTFDQETLESTKAIARELVQIDYNPEIELLSSLFSKSKAPLVFSHNDLHQNNILLMHHVDKTCSFDNRIVLIDFEYCSYNYRTFDIANHLSEWCFDYNNDDYPFFKASTDSFPSDDKQRQFLRNYIAQSEPDLVKQDGEAPHGRLEDRVEVLFDEMKPFLLASNLLWALWAIHMACTSKIKFGYWEMAKNKWDVYVFCKHRFQNGFVSSTSICT